MVNMVREKVVMELLEIIINIELIKQPMIAIDKHKLTELDISLHCLQILPNTPQEKQ